MVQVAPRVQAVPPVPPAAPGPAGQPTGPVAQALRVRAFMANLEAVGMPKEGEPATTQSVTGAPPCMQYEATFKVRLPVTALPLLTGLLGPDGAAVFTASQATGA